MDIDPRQFLGLSGIAVVVALIQLVKVTIPDLNPRFWPVTALLLAVLWNVGLAFYLRADPLLAVIVGLITGLSASGIYSQARTVAKDA